MKATVYSGLLALALMASAAGSSAAQDAAAVQEARPAQAPRPGELNPQASRVYIFVDKKGLGHQHAVEGKLTSGTVRLGAAEAAGQLVFDMQSFDADTTAARRYLRLEGETEPSTRTKVNQNMKGDHVLDVARYPTATFDVDSAIATGQQSSDGQPVYELTGAFTLHGAKRPLKVSATVEQARGWLHLRGKFTINQTAYGMTPYSAAFGAIGVADPLVIYGDLWVAPSETIAMATIPERRK